MPESSAITVVPAAAADVDAINALLAEARDWLHAKGIMQWAEPLPPNWVAKCVKGGKFHIAREQGQIIGTLRLVWTDEDRLWGDSVQAGYLGKLVVVRAAAGRGLGLELLRAAERIVAAAGRKMLRLDCWAGNSRLISYYEAAGFRRGGTASVGEFEVVLFEKKIVLRNTATSAS